MTRVISHLLNAIGSCRTPCGGSSNMQETLCKRSAPSCPCLACFPMQILSAFPDGERHYLISLGKGERYPLVFVACQWRLCHSLV